MTCRDYRDLPHVVALCVLAGLTSAAIGYSIGWRRAERHLTPLLYARGYDYGVADGFRQALSEPEGLAPPVLEEEPQSSLVPSGR